MKKYVIRIIGALCILGVAALMFLPAWFQVEGVKERELKDVRSDVNGAIDTVSRRIQWHLDEDDDFEDELKDNDLPYKEKNVKKMFKGWTNLTKTLLNSEISLKDITTLAAKTPGVVEELSNILELPPNVVNDVFLNATSYIVLSGRDAAVDVDFETLQAESYNLQDAAAEAVEDTDGLKLVCYGVVAAIGLVLALAVLAAVTHVLNKGRWVKYIFMILLIALVAGSTVVIPIINETLADTMGDNVLMKVMEDAELKMTVYPYLAVALMFVPVVLDMIFERKNKYNGG